MFPFDKFPAILLSTVLSFFSTAALCNADYNLGYEAAMAGNYKRAISLWKPLAEKGNAAAQYTLGWMYESGQGVKKNTKQALHWYRKAAEQGNVAAEYVLATMYKRGVGVKQNDKLAMQWYTKAANQGDAIAQFQLGKHFQRGAGVAQSDQQSLYWFEKAANQGHTMAQINLGRIYELGTGVDVDYKKTLYWYKKSATQNNALGQFHLAHMYEYGLGVEQDLNKAKSLYLLSAEGHYSPSAYKVGELYELGKGNDVDYKKAIKWYQQSAKKGHSSAQLKLGNLYREGKGTHKDIRSAITWYSQAAIQNNPAAHYQLALLYLQGVKSEQYTQLLKVNEKKAFHHFEAASKLGFALAHAQLAYLYEQGIATNVNMQRAAELYHQSNEPWAIERYRAINKRLMCHNTASTKLFSVQIACATRDILREQIKKNSITPIDEDSHNWSDTYFTGAIIRGTSQLKVTYTRENHFVSAEYTFIGRDDPTLIGKIKQKLQQRYGKPLKNSGDVEQGPASFEWQLEDGVHIKVDRDWPDTTTFVRYFVPEKQRELQAQQRISTDKNYIAPESQQQQATQVNLF